MVLSRCVRADQDRVKSVGTGTHSHSNGSHVHRQTGDSSLWSRDATGWDVTLTRQRACDPSFVRSPQVTPPCHCPQVDGRTDGRSVGESCGRTDHGTSRVVPVHRSVAAVRCERCPSATEGSVPCRRTRPSRRSRQDAGSLSRPPQSDPGRSRESTLDRLWNLPLSVRIPKQAVFL